MSRRARKLPRLALLQDYDLSFHALRSRCYASCAQFIPKDASCEENRGQLGLSSWRLFRCSKDLRNLNFLSSRLLGFQMSLAHGHYVRFFHSGGGFFSVRSKLGRHGCHRSVVGFGQRKGLRLWIHKFVPVIVRPDRTTLLQLPPSRLGPLRT